MLAIPELVARFLLGVELSASGIAVARVAGFALLSLAIACWPSENDVPAPVTRALFVYNLVAGLYLGYLRVGGEFAGFLLLPASMVHILFALLLVRPAYQGASAAE